MISSALVRNTENQLVLLGIVLASALAWSVLLAGASTGRMVVCINGGSAFSPSNFGQAMDLLAMWLIMMPAMMLPAAAFDILEESSRYPGRSGSFSAAWSFCGGYLVVLTVAGIAAAGLHGTLQSAGLLAQGARIGDPFLGGAVLAITGLYQMSPMKRASLRRCDRDMRENSRGLDPTLSGLRHGLACLDCCGMMLCLQFVVGVMDIAWMAMFVLWLLAERMLPFRRELATLSGIALIIGGGAMAFG